MKSFKITIIDKLLLHNNPKSYVGVEIISDIIRGAIDFQSGCEIPCQLNILPPTVDFDESSMKLLLTETSGCIVMLPYHSRPDYLDTYRLLASRIPVVSILSHPDTKPFFYIGLDEKKGMNLLVDHLVSEGFRKIGFCSRDIESFSIERLNGYLSACERNNIHPEQNWIHTKITSGGYNQPRENRTYRKKRPDTENYSSEKEAIFSLFTRITQQRTPPDAIIFDSDSLAGWFRYYAGEQGIAIPDTIGIAGIDNNRYTWSAFDLHFLTTIGQNFYELGKFAVSTLLDRIRNKDAPANGKILIEPELIIRKSSLHNNRSNAEAFHFSSFVNEYIRRNYAKHGLAADMARILNLNPVYFSNKFKTIMRKNFVTYLTDYRLEKSKFLMNNTGMGISRICHESGFNSYNTFSECFKKKYGYSATQYRKRRIK